SVLQIATGMNIPGFQLDTSYTPVPVNPHPDHEAQLTAVNEEVVVVRGTVEQSKKADLEQQPNVLKVWKDTRISPFASTLMELPQTIESRSFVRPMEGFATCPIGTCDCSPGTAKGTITEVAQYLGVDQLWAAGKRGTGIVIGIVDGGITAVGRPVKPGE